MAQALLGHAPGDHVSVKIVGAVMLAGDRVALKGYVHHEPKGDGYRSTELVPVEIAVLSAGRCDDPVAAAEEALEAMKAGVEPRVGAPEPRAAESSDGAPLGLGLPFALVAVAIALVAVGVLGHYGRIPLLELGLIFASLALFVLRRRRWMPDFAPLADAQLRSTQYRWHSKRWLGVVLFLAVPMAGMALLPETSNATDQLIRRWGPLSLAAAPLVLAIALWHSDGGGAAIAWRMLRARRLDASAKPGTFGAIEGPLRAPIERTIRYDRDETARTTRTEDQGTRTVYDYVISAAVSVTRGGVTVGDGDESVYVTLGRAEFGAARRLVLATGNRLGHFADLIERGAAGDSALMVGRLAQLGGQRRMKVTGPQSLLIYAAPGDARASLWRQFLLHYLSVAALLGLCAAMVAIALIR